MPEHVADDEFLIKLCLDLLLYSCVNSIFTHNGDALLESYNHSNFTICLNLYATGIV